MAMLHVFATGVDASPGTGRGHTQKVVLDRTASDVEASSAFCRATTCTRPSPTANGVAPGPKLRHPSGSFLDHWNADFGSNTIEIWGAQRLSLGLHRPEESA